MSGEILEYLDICHGKIPSRQFASLVPLIIADLDEERTAGLERGRGLDQQTGDGLQAIRAAIESGARFEVPHFRHESGYDAAGDVRRVGEDQIGRLV